MPQLRIHETAWANVLTCKLLPDEAIQPELFKKLRTENQGLFVVPTANYQDSEVTLTYSLTGMVSLSTVQQYRELILVDWLQLLQALSSQLSVAKYCGSLLLDPDYIFLYGRPNVYIDYAHPRLICLPLIHDDDYGYYEEKGAVYLAELSEPCIHLARADSRLNNELSDNLLLAAYETPGIFAQAIRDCLHVLPEKAEYTTLDPISAAPGKVAKIMPLKKTEKVIPKNKEKQPSLAFILVMQICLLLVAGISSYLGLLNNLFNRNLILILLFIFIILDLVLLFSKRSPLKEGEGKQEHIDFESMPQKTIPALRTHKNRQELIKTIQPPAQLIPLETAYSDISLSQQEEYPDFQVANILRPVFIIGSDPIHCDLCLHSSEILSQHAAIEYLPSGYQLQNIQLLSETAKEPNPEAGIWLDGIKLSPGQTAALEDGDSIRIGRYIYQLTIDSG